MSLTKGKFLTGHRCAKLFWWETHEPEAPELALANKAGALRRHGTAVGVRARQDFPGGMLIDRASLSRPEQLTATRAAVASFDKPIFEASFAPDSLWASVDILIPMPSNGAWNLIEVKGSLDTNEEHVLDAAFQTHVARRAGLDIRRVELMHLNRAHLHPDQNPLFARMDVTSEVEAALGSIPQQVEVLRSTLSGSAPPEVPVGDHCHAPNDCAFLGRCAPRTEAHPIETLYYLGKKKARELRAKGITQVQDVPSDIRLRPPAERQVRSLKLGQLIIEPGLRITLDALKEPIAHLDFETIMPALPVWPGCRPLEAAPVQFSVHQHSSAGTGTHSAFLAEPGEPPFAAMAEALIAATRESKTVLAWYASVEIGCIQWLAQAVPHRANELNDLADRIVDLLPIVRDNVYHPNFHGKFGLKAVVPALLPELAYDDLDVADGLTASGLLEDVLLHPETFTDAERTDIRTKLLAYCERDTAVMVALLDWLRRHAN